MNRRIDSGVVPGEVAGYDYSVGGWELIVSRSPFHHSVTATARSGQWEDGYFRSSILHNQGFYNLMEFDTDPTEFTIDAMLDKAMMKFRELLDERSPMGKLLIESEKMLKDIHRSIDERFAALKAETEENFGIFEARFRTKSFYVPFSIRNGYRPMTMYDFRDLFRELEGVIAVGFTGDVFVIETRRYRHQQLIMELSMDLRELMYRYFPIGVMATMGINYIDDYGLITIEAR